MTVILLLVFVGQVYGADFKETLQSGMKSLQVLKGDPALCVITDAPYVKLEGQGCGLYVDLIQEQTGCSVGRGNLLFLHRASNYPLKIVLFSVRSQRCAAICWSDGRWMSRTYDISIETLSQKDAWKNIGPPLAPDAFAVATVCHAWSAGVPADMLKCAELHGHLCPGVTAGYFLARFILKQYPIKEHEQYRWFGGPVNCKEDALQVILDVTAGKKTLITEKLAAHEQEQAGLNKAAGILIVWNKKEKRGKGIVLGFDWDKAPEKDKLQKLLNMLPYVDRPETFVPVIKAFDVSLPIMERLTEERSNPYKWLGLLQ